MKINSPILYCCYNRLENIKKSLKPLTRIANTKIYIVMDGPKDDPEDKLLCEKIKHIISGYKFKSEVITYFRKKNLGCKLSVAGAISWFFTKEDKGIILEDDMIVTDSFYQFCDYGLREYENNDSIMMISGTNYIGENIQSNEYNYSEHFLIWGWATWKRAWDKYDIEMNKWKDKKNQIKIRKRFTLREFKFLEKKFNSYYSDYYDTWDIQWYFSCILNNGMTVMPESNLVSNFGQDGTHSKSYYKTLFMKFGTLDVQKIIKPHNLIVNRKIDLKIHKIFNFKNKIFSIIKSTIKLIIKKLSIKEIKSPTRW